LQVSINTHLYPFNIRLHESVRLAHREKEGEGRPPRHIDTCRASANPENRMEVNLTPDQKAFVRQAIESGRLHREEEAVQEALSLWEERERSRAEILTAVDVAEASIERGEGRTITQESMRQLADEVKQRGRGRLAAEQSSPR
jgi:putative addiction module CopG family antidote